MAYLKRIGALGFVCLLAACANLIIWEEVLHEGKDRLVVSFLDVGQGDAIFIESPTGATMLVDAGPDNSVLRGLGGAMPLFDRSIDIALATHPDKDHIAGFVDVLSRYRVGALIESGVESDNGVDDAIHEIADRKKIKRIVARRGMTVDLGGGAKLFIIYPDSDTSRMETNEASIVAKLVYGDTSFLLTGDSPKFVEAHLGDIDGDKLDSDVLKAGHHGSDTSSSPGFVALVSPQYAVISAGKDNAYGHPKQSVLSTLAAAGAAIDETFVEGTITFESDGTMIVKK